MNGEGHPSETLADPDMPPRPWPPASTANRGDVIGRYALLEQLGQGAMGVVFAAYDPELDRKVALKVLHQLEGGSEGDSQGEQRLLREAKALARLNHPNVVAVHDVGTHEGRVFVAMEFVAGETLGTWTRRRSLRWRDVVDVFVRAGRGLAAAHAAGLVHRDFKPANVIVGDDGRVRVMDFGLAYRAHRETVPSRERQSPASEEPAADGPLELTRRGARMGTPAYMAPEQHLALPTDARTDQFSFCIALHEALYGERPFAGQSIAELAFNVTRGRVREPGRAGEVESWVRDVLLRGLAVAPEDRWPSMDALLGALTSDPRARRRRWLTRLGATGVLLLAAALTYRLGVASRDVCAGAASMLAGTWDEARRLAVEQSFWQTGLGYAAESAARANAMLDAYSAAWVEHRTDACEATHVRGDQSGELLDLRMACLDRRASQLRALVDVLVDADPKIVEKAVQAAAALPTLERCGDADALRTPVAPPEDPQTRARVAAIRTEIDRVDALANAGRFEVGLEAIHAITTEARALGYRPLEAEALRYQGMLLERAGDYTQAERSLDEAEYLARAGRHDRIAVESAIELVYVVGYRQARHQEGLRWARHARAEVERLGGSDEYLGKLLNNEGVVLERQGEYARALARFEEALAIWSGAFGDEHPRLASSHNNIGLVLHRLGHQTQALEHLERARTIWTSALGPEHPLVGTALNNIGLAYEKLEDHDRALDAYARALALRERSLGADHPAVATCVNNIANMLYERERVEEAVEHYERALAIRERAFGPNHPRVALVIDNLGAVLNHLGDHDGALSHHLRALTIFESAFGSEHPELGPTFENLAKVHAARGQPAQARVYQRKADAIRERTAAGEGR